MTPFEFDNDLLTLLKKYGYKTEGIQEAVIKVGREKIPEINIEYYQGS